MPRIQSLSLEVTSHKAYLHDQIASLKRRHPRAGKNYESFLLKLFGLFSDNPPISWRFVGASENCVAFRVINRRTGRSSNFLRVFPKWGMAIIPSVHERFRSFFPRRKGWYNSGDEVYLDFSEFTQSKQERYLKAIESIILTNHDLTINFSAYINQNNQ